MNKEMEAILASTAVDTDVLSPSLKYGLDPSGSWCLAKREATVFALGSSYSPNGVKMISVPFGSTTEWMDPQTLIFTAEFENLDTVNAAWPATPDPAVLFERMDLRLGGQLVESVTEVGRVNELFTRLTMSPQKKLNLAQMGFGTQVPFADQDWAAAKNHDAATIAAGGSRRIMWKANLSGLLTQHRWLPLYALSGQGLVVNFFLAPVNDSLIASHSGVTYSQSYRLKDVKAHVNMCTVSDELMESFQGQLLSGTALRIPIKKVESIYSYIPSSVTNSKFDIPLSRAYTRLCTLFASFTQEPPADGSGKAKLCNTFYTHTGSAETLAYSLQLGTRRIPDNDSVGFAEAWYRLLNALGMAGSMAHSSGITYEDYSTNSFCLAIDTEKIPHLAASGENLSNTSVIQLKISGFGTQAEHLPSRCHLVTQTDAVIEIRDTTVELFE
jgi:hypothetical protein